MMYYLYPTRVDYHCYYTASVDNCYYTVRHSVNNNDNLQVQLDLSGFYPSVLILL